MHNPSLEPTVPDRPAEPFRPQSRTFWLSFFVLAVVSFTLFFYKLGSWPRDHDEVAGLVEVGALEWDAHSSFDTQLQKMSKLLPVWANTQKLFLTLLPADEFGSRVLSAICGMMIVLSVFLLGWQWQGGRFAAALAIIIGMSQCLVWLSQHNRFYSQSLLLFTWSMGAFWWPTKRNVIALVLCVGLSLMAVLCHNLFVVVYGIFFVASLICSTVGASPGVSC